MSAPTPAAPRSSKSEAKERDDYRGKDDARTLADAEAIRSDPHRMNAARRHLEHSVRALRKAHDGKRKRNRR